MAALAPFFRPRTYFYALSSHLVSTTAPPSYFHTARPRYGELPQPAGRKWAGISRWFLPVRPRRSTSVQREKRRSRSRLPLYLAATTGVLGLSLYFKLKDSIHNADIATEAGTSQLGLPLYSTEEVAKHKTKDTGIWVTYKNGVYDITDYVSSHPGGAKILLAAGSSIDHFWNMYAAHKSEEIFKMLESFRIGNFEPKEDDLKREETDPFSNDPKRHPALSPSSMKPFNAEPPLMLLTEKFLTPNELFFVRNHLPVPTVDLSSFKLQVMEEGSSKIANLSLDCIKGFQKRVVTAAIQCAGNRRSEMKRIKTVKGLNWGSAAIGNATWGGVRLTDILKHSGINIHDTAFKHVQFEGLDKDPEGLPYGASIPIDLLKLAEDDVILAYEMNGQELPRDHGYPLRLIIPGVVGARQVKWLKRIVLSKDESPSHWQQRDYKGFNPSIDWHNVDFSQSVSIQQYPVQSVMCDPYDDMELEEDADEVVVKGYAWSGGGRGIIRVDVSVDGGQTWQCADLKPPNQPLYHTWAWTLWESTISLPEEHQGKVEIICKAVDAAYNVQPDTVNGIWNLRGVLSNAWHRITVKIPKSS